MGKTDGISSRHEQVPVWDAEVLGGGSPIKYVREDWQAAPATWKVWINPRADRPQAMTHQAHSAPPQE